MPSLTSISKKMAETANLVLSPIGLKLSRSSHDWGDVSSFIPFEQTIIEAKNSGLPLGEYIDARQGIAGATQAVIDEMKRLGVFEQPLHTILEIGPGSGRYLERTLRECSPERYEIYETAADWAAYLIRTFPVLSQPTDGTHLRATPASSIDLVQAHKVFSTVTFVTTAGYWCEMDRVLKPGGYLVFDAMTERCLPPATIEAWAGRGIPSHSSYPAAMPSEAIEGFFSARQYRLVGSFLSPMPPGQTELFVFRKSSA
ncbi:methyltransferase domain-containing protein [Bradyrhizobium sp.]|uniref:methyltransferase domain-containing protein n=1 Tax=Bradyrhizobium sp. TaxID=376 RepID=UPI0025C1645C|nr:methyltransferase domain-containing protein [Bradyrhizobium sp.]